LAALLAQSTPRPTDPDSEFVRTASAAGLGELRLAQLAVKQGTTDIVKQFAAKVADDQAKANEELKAISAKSGTPVAKTEGAKDGAFYGALSGLSGSSFDGVYISAMVTDHREDISAFQKEVDTGKNQAIQDYARRRLPILKEHLRLAENAASSLGVEPTPTGGR
jgi:putative membrane protein